MEWGGASVLMCVFLFFFLFFCGISVRSVETMFVNGRDCTRSD